MKKRLNKKRTGRQWSDIVRRRNRKIEKLKDKLAIVQNAYRELAHHHNEKCTCTEIYC